MIKHFLQHGMMPAWIANTDHYNLLVTSSSNKLQGREYLYLRKNISPPISLKIFTQCLFIYDIQLNLWQHK